MTFLPGSIRGGHGAKLLGLRVQPVLLPAG
jgi:hypothetical protein